MDHTPRAIFAMIQAGMKEKVFKSNTHGTAFPVTTVLYAAPGNPYY
jgi:hypothetical protein